MRITMVQLKYNPLTQNLQGRNVVMVDDSLVRGNTVSQLVSLVRSAGAKTVHVRIASPPIRHPCYMGIDMKSKEELIAGFKSVEEIRDIIGADSLAYLSHEGMIESISTIEEPIQTENKPKEEKPVVDENTEQKPTVLEKKEEKPEAEQKPAVLEKKEETPKTVQIPAVLEKKEEKPEPEQKPTVPEKKEEKSETKQIPAVLEKMEEKPETEQKPAVLEKPETGQKLVVLEKKEETVVLEKKEETPKTEQKPVVLEKKEETEQKSTVLQKQETKTEQSEVPPQLPKKEEQLPPTTKPKLVEALSKHVGFCSACFTGDYPLDIEDIDYICGLDV